MFSKPSNDTIRYARGKLTDYQCIYRVNIDGSIGSEKSDSDKNKIDWNKKVYDKIYESPTFVPEKNNRIKKTVAELKEIKRICDDNNIELCLFFTPTHITTYLSDDLNNFNNFKQEVSQISSFYDFSTINFITINNFDRIAQIKFQKAEQCEFIEGELSDTERGDGGFGHTGK